MDPLRQSARSVPTHLWHLQGQSDRTDLSRQSGHSVLSHPSDPEARMDLSRQSDRSVPTHLWHLQGQLVRMGLLIHSDRLDPEHLMDLVDQPGRTGPHFPWVR